MRMKQFTKQEQLTFWNSYEEDFKGEKVSDVVIGLSKRFIGGSILDVGGGNGALLHRLKKRYRGRKVTAIDLVPRSNGVRKGDCTNLDFDDARFDTIFCMDVIEHLSDEDLDDCLNEANRVLRTGGYAIFTTLNNERLEGSTVACPECQCKFHRWGHCQVFDGIRVERLFKKKGFKVVKMRILHLKLLATFPISATIFYLLRFDRLLAKKVAPVHEDLFFVVRKIKDV